MQLTLTATTGFPVGDCQVLTLTASGTNANLYTGASPPCITVGRRSFYVQHQYENTPELVFGVPSEPFTVFVDQPLAPGVSLTLTPFTTATNGVRLSFQPAQLVFSSAVQTQIVTLTVAESNIPFGASFSVSWIAEGVNGGSYSSTLNNWPTEFIVGSTTPVQVSITTDSILIGEEIYGAGTYISGLSDVYD